MVYLESLLRVSQTVVKMLIKLCSHLEFGILLQTHSHGWQNSVPHSNMTEALTFFLAVRQKLLSTLRIHLPSLPHGSTESS